jgi:hypothetical protein
LGHRCTFLFAPDHSLMGWATLLGVAKGPGVLSHKTGGRDRPGVTRPAQRFAI